MSSEDSSKEETSDGRVVLPSTIIPSRYDVKITPDLEAFTFTGEIVVQLTTSADLDKECCEIVMHAKELCFVSASYVVVGVDGGASVDAEQINDNKKSTTVTFIFPTPIPPSSTLTLTIHYLGFLNNQMAGFYRSSYTDINGTKKTMASTQFEALDARRAFPCWDEPSRKAIFGITLVVPYNLTAFSNMPEQSSRTILHANERKTGDSTKLREVVFLDSPLMSSYLVAFCVGEFDFLQSQTKSGVLLRVYTPPGNSATGKFALDCAVKALDVYDEFFGVPYPLPKLDMVGVPEFAMGAMENWGLVVYRQTDLLIDPEMASDAQKQRVCTVVTHELAHQWFGNLVTMGWWNDLWLNEGFASWAENYAADIIFPKWGMWDQFTTGHLSYAMKLDALKTSHPIQVPIAHAEEVEEVFDGISYCKGGSVVRMISAVLGPKAFQAGLAAYMKKYAYGNTSTTDLWNAWEESSGIPVGEMMASWTEQMGFPVLRVVGEEWEVDKVRLTLEQSWFLSDGSDYENEEEAGKRWCIPIFTCTEAGTQADTTFLREKTVTIEVPLANEEGWVKLNAGQEVPMRVINTTSMNKRLAKGIKSKALPICDRAALLTDGYALVKAGQMPPEDLVRLLSSYTEEDEYIVWQGLSSVLNGLKSIMEANSPVMHDKFIEVAKKLVLRMIGDVGWEKKETDGHQTVLLRATIIGLLSTFCSTDEAVISEARRRFEKFLLDPTDMQGLPSDMRSTVFRIVLKNGGKKEYDAIKAYFFTSTDGAEQKLVLGSLGSIKCNQLKLETLQWCISGEVKLQDFFYTIGSVSGSSMEGMDMTWTFFCAQLENIKGMIGKASPSLMQACMSYSTMGFCTLERADEVEEFFKVNPLPTCDRKIAQILEGIRTNAKFFERLAGSDLVKDEFWDTL